MIEESTQLEQFWRVLAGLSLRGGHILEVLTASRVRAEGRGDEHQRAPHSIGAHLFERIHEKRMPVAISPVHRKLQAIGVEFAPQGCNELSILIIDRTPAPAMKVVLCNLEQTFPRHIAAPQDDLEKRDHVLPPLRPSERQHQQSVELRHPLTLEGRAPSEDHLKT